MEKRGKISGWKKVVRFLAFWLIFLALLAGTMFVLNKHHEKEMNPEILQHGKDMQVLFSGSSHIFNSLSPMDLWDSFGIASYNIATGGETMPVSYWHLRNVLDYTDPQIVVLDLYGNYFDGKVFVNGNPRVWLNSVPLSRNKVRAALDLYGKDSYLEVLFPFLYEHTRWNDLEPADVRAAQPDLLQGFERNATVTPQPHCQPAQGLEPGEGNELGLTYLQKIIDLCKENSTTEDPDVEQAVNDALALVRKNGLEPLDFRLQNVVDPATDFYNGEHLNISGAQKITHWLGQWLRNEAGVPDLRESNAELTTRWNENYSEYRHLKRVEMENAAKIEELLIRLRDTDYSCILSIPSDLYLWTDDSYAYVRDLLENLGIELTGQENETGLYAVVDSRGAAFTAQYGPGLVQTDWGTVEWQNRAEKTDETLPLFFVGEDSYSFYGSWDYSNTANILVIENVTGNIIYHHIFAMGSNF